MRRPLLDATALAAVSTERDAAVAGLADADELLRADPEPMDAGEVRELGADIRADAENQPLSEFRSALADLDLAPGEQTAEHLLDYLDAAHAVQASHAEEIAEKAGPLLDRRLAVQAVARALAGGVLLEFDWATTVNAHGTGGSYGGTSYWFSADGGYATVTLSDSVATMWPGAGVQAPAVHEVGHAILARTDCNTLFFDSEFTEGGEEPWATAWAIGQGHTADGNGESIYGRPPDALIDMSTECR
jgi:hypothetical protein